MAERTRDYSDFDISFIPHPVTGDLVKKTGVASVNQSIVNLVITHFWERPFRSFIGSNATTFLFEPISDMMARNLENEIATTITNFEPRVVLKAVYVEPIVEQNGYSVDVVFNMLNTNIPYKATMFLSRVR